MGRSTNYSLKEKYKYQYEDTEEVIDKALFEGLSDSMDKCSIDRLQIQTNIENVHKVELGTINDYDPFA